MHRTISQIKIIHAPEAISNSNKRRHNIQYQQHTAYYNTIPLSLCVCSLLCSQSSMVDILKLLKLFHFKADNVITERHGGHLL